MEADNSSETFITTYETPRCYNQEKRDGQVGTIFSGNRCTDLFINPVTFV
jgi:hypothetical protein